MLFEAVFCIMFFVLPLLGMLVSIIVGVIKREKGQRKPPTYSHEVGEHSEMYYPLTVPTYRGGLVEVIDTS